MATKQIKRPDLSIEKNYSGIIAGIDEVGRGPWAGPVVSAAVVFTNHNLPKSLSDHIHDSKKLTEKKRDLLYDALIGFDDCHIAIAEATVEEIDQLNIAQATFLAMQRAVTSLGMDIDVALIDGRSVPDLPCKAVPVVGGDSISLSIAAASIIAKVSRDRYMRDLAKEFPDYGWETNVGYGTKAHQLALKAHGVSPHHRKSFAPVKEILEAA